MVVVTTVRLSDRTEALRHAQPAPPNPPLSRPRGTRKRDIVDTERVAFKCDVLKRGENPEGGKPRLRKHCRTVATIEERRAGPP